MALTTKELSLVKDNVLMSQNSVRFIRGCAENTTDPQVKALCNQVAEGCERDINIILKHVSADAIQ